MGIIKAAKLAFDYLRYEEEGEEPEVNRAIDHVDLDIEEGKFIAILGHNGKRKVHAGKTYQWFAGAYRGNSVGGSHEYRFGCRYLEYPSEGRHGFSESG